ncbi:MAG: hypothetical protein AAGC70_09495 [Pseudomonadota bacterium]
MEDLIRSGRVADLILALLGLEFLLILLWRQLRGQRLAVMQLWPFFASGACLVCAFRSGVQQDDWQWTAMWFAAAFVVHLIDLKQRWPAANR